MESPPRTTRSRARREQDVSPSPTQDDAPAAAAAPSSVKKRAPSSSKKVGSSGSGKSSSAGKSSGSSGTAIALLLALVAVAAGVAYRQYTEGHKGAAAPAPHRSTLEHWEPEPPMTPEELAVFEQAAEEHYGMPPGTQLPDAYVEEHHATHAPPDVQAEPEAQYQEMAEEWAGEEAAPEQEEATNAEPAGTRGAEYTAAVATFDAAVHQQYLDLPLWPQTTEEELTGSWEFNQNVYDYSASQPMANVLSWEAPRLVLFPSFLSPEEVDHMIAVSRDNLERSEVLVAEGDDTQSDIRTSFGFWPEADHVVSAISERIHRLTGIPEQFGEGLYVLNYQNGQKYEAHNDHCMDGYMGNTAEPACLDFLKRAGGPECGPGKGGPTCGDRVATFILYLKSPTGGGQTAFPDAEITKEAMGAEHRSGNSPGEWYCSDDRALAAAPAPGTGVLFWDYRPGNGSNTGSYKDGTAEPAAETVHAAMHSGCPVLEGEKYIATRWIRAAGFDYPR